MVGQHCTLASCDRRHIFIPLQSWFGSAGITQQPLGGVLDEYNIPKGVFPKNHSRYKFEPYEGGNSGKLIITVPNIMEVRFSDGHMLRFDTEIICSIEEGQVTDIEGVKSQGNLRWIDVTAIIVRGDKMDFMCGSKKTKEIKWYTSQRDGVEVFKY